MRTIANFVSGLLLSALFLLPVSVCAAELQPFFTLKVSGVNTLISVAEKISTMAGVADDPSFREIIKTAKDSKGFDHNGIIGIAAAVNENGSICPIILLPVTDLWKVEIAGYPDIFDSIRPFLEKKGADRTNINTPVGQTFVALQKQGYLVITSEDAVDQLPADPKKLFADLEKYTLGVKFDLEKVEFETLEVNLFAPLIFMAMMQNPDAGEQIENAIEIYRELFKEFATDYYGVTFDPQTANLELAYTIGPRKGSDMAKQFAGYKEQPTIFKGFRGVPGNTVFSFGASATYGKVNFKDNFKDNPLMAASMKQWEAFAEGLLEQVTSEDESGELTEFVNKLMGSFQKIIEIENGRGASDSALSFDTEGTLLAAFTVGSLAEIQEFVSLLVDFGGEKIGPFAEMLEIDFKTLVKQNYATIEGFKVSSFAVPMDKAAPFLSGPTEGLKDLSPGFFWAVKDASGKQAIALAVGVDFAKTEQAFKSALEQTKTPAPVQKPLGVVSVQGLGKFLQQKVYPMVEKAKGPDPAAQKGLAMLASAGNEATATMDVDCASDKMEASFRISGKAIETIVSFVKFVIESDRTRPAQNF